MFQRTKTRQLRVTHAQGIHARPSLAIVKKAREFTSKVTIRRGEEEANAGEIIEVLSLGVPCGTEITLSAKGPDASEALDALEKLFAENFGFGESDDALRNPYPPSAE